MSAKHPKADIRQDWSRMSANDPKRTPNRVPKKLTKFDKLVAVYVQIGKNLEQIGHPILRQVTQICLRTSDLREQMKNENPPAPPSLAVPGLEQGLRDLLPMLLNAPAEIRSQAVECYRDALQEHYPDFLEKDQEKLKKVFARGRVRTESEWYLLQARLDEIEGDPAHQKEVEMLWMLMDSYAG